MSDLQKLALSFAKRDFHKWRFHYWHKIEGRSREEIEAYIEDVYDVAYNKHADSILALFQADEFLYAAYFRDTFAEEDFRLAYASDIVLQLVDIVPDTVWNGDGK